MSEPLNKPISGKFYEDDIQRVSKKENFWTVSEVLKKIRRNKKIEYLVSFEDYPSKFDFWIPETDMKRLKSLT